MAHTSATSYDILVAIGFPVLLYYLLRVVYNLYFHPLRKFPGPVKRAIAYLFYYWSLCTGKQARDEHEYHDTYGSVVRTTPNSLSFTTIQAWKDIFDSKQPGNWFEKDPKYYTHTMRGAGDIIACSAQDHARHRKLISHAFSDIALREQEPLVKKHIDLLIQQLKQHPLVDITIWYNFTTFDIVGDLALGESFKALESGQYHPWVSKIFDNIKYMSIFRLAKGYPLTFGSFLAILKPVMTRLMQEHARYSDEKVNRRIARQTDRKDFYSYISRYNDGRSLSDAELKNDMEIIVVAGSETTATLLSGATYLLMKHPAILKKLESEICQFSTEAELTFLSTGQLPYLNAVIQESFRLYPPAPIGAPRIVKPGGAVIDGHYVPGGTAVGIAHYAAFRSKQNFRDPEEFVPERWLKDRPAMYENDQRSVMLPFSKGPRDCVGRNLAMHEIRNVLARIIWNFKLEPHQWNEDWMNQKTYILWDKPPLWVHLRPRFPVTG